MPCSNSSHDGQVPCSWQGGLPPFQCWKVPSDLCHRLWRGSHLADPANTCPRTPPVATCMHELQQAMQDSLGCCQRRLYPCPLDTRRFPRRTARAVRAARYGDQPRFQAAGDGVPSMAYIRGGRAAQVGYNYGSSISSSSSSSSSASAARPSKRHRRDNNPLCGGPFTMHCLPPTLHSTLEDVPSLRSAS